MTSPLALPGTPEAVWRTWSVPSTWPSLALQPAGHAVIACPHPDDETLAVGGTINLLCRLGWHVDLVAVSDGDRSHPPTADRDAEALVALRRSEQRHAVRRLGIDADRTHRLGVGDTRVAEHTPRVTSALAALLAPGDWLLAPWEHDGNRDHDAMGRAAVTAAERTGARLLRYPLWAWHWMTPQHPLLKTWQPLRVDLDDAALQAKRDAIAAYTSQTNATDGPAILPPDMLERHDRAWEVVLA